MNQITTFRRATLNDIDILIDYRIKFLKEIGQKSTPEAEAALRINLQKYLKKSFKAKTYIVWIAEIENKPVGFGGMVIRSQPGNFQVPNGKIGYILNMYTVPKFRKNGIGNDIIKLFLNDAKELKLDRVDLHATEMGEPLYRKFGFAESDYKFLELPLK
ncbi:MAG: GNAT family N-acetyltransferase [Candidatus Cloacimonadales bacterium]|nr:GNAT family N-acetyltransferase [Candidatus Cloacimonadales bacterium]